MVCERKEKGVYSLSTAAASLIFEKGRILPHLTEKEGVTTTLVFFPIS